jgi:hypothetical protein
MKPDDKILAAFNLACQRRQLDLAEALLEALEALGQPRRSVKPDPGQVDAAREQLADLRAFRRRGRPH